MAGCRGRARRRSQAKAGWRRRWVRVAPPSGDPRGGGPKGASRGPPASRLRPAPGAFLRHFKGGGGDPSPLPAASCPQARLGAGVGTRSPWPPKAVLGNAGAQGLPVHAAGAGGAVPGRCGQPQGSWDGGRAAGQRDTGLNGGTEGRTEPSAEAPTAPLPLSPPQIWAGASRAPDAPQPPVSGCPHPGGATSTPWLHPAWPRVLREWRDGMGTGRGRDGMRRGRDTDRDGMSLQALGEREKC